MGMTFDPLQHLHPVVAAIRAGVQSRKRKSQYPNNRPRSRFTKEDEQQHVRDRAVDSDSDPDLDEDIEDSLAFNTNSLLPLHFTFHTKCAHAIPRSLKRTRALSDIDGELSSCFCKKKRRIRLVLVTSRLSQPFSLPATNIADKGSCKVAVFAKQHQSRQSSPAKNVLRKIAILNSVRKVLAGGFMAGAASVTVGELQFLQDQKKVEREVARLLGVGRLVNVAPAKKSDRSVDDDTLEAWPESRDGIVSGSVGLPQHVEHGPLPPSPLSLPPFDENEDDEEDYRFTVHWDEDDDDPEDGVYSDWGAAGCAVEDDGAGEDEEYTDAFTNVMPELVIRRRG